MTSHKVKPRPTNGSAEADPILSVSSPTSERVTEHFPRGSASSQWTMLPFLNHLMALKNLNNMLKGIPA